MAWPHTHHLVHDRNTDVLLEREWLLTNGTGAFAMGTALGANTRRYHGLLIAAQTPPVGRVMLLNQVHEQLELTAEGQTQLIEFSTCLFRDDQGGLLFAPDAPPLLRRIDRGLDMIWSYQWGGLTFTRQLILHHDQPACTLRYDLTGLGTVCESARLRLRPMVTLRDFHSLAGRDDDAMTAENVDGSMVVRRGELAATYHAPGAELALAPDWWYRVHYPIEARRGQGDCEDYFVPGELTIDLPTSDDASAVMTAALGTTPAQPVANTRQRAASLEPIRKALAGRISPELFPSTGNELPAILAQAADDFIVKRRVGEKTLSTILAGYPWFSDWGRDTFIALPGLMLCTGRHAEARDTLETFARSMQGGLVPNRFDDNDPTKAHYNTVDASLWFVHSALAYYEETADQPAWDDWLADACLQVIDAYREGTCARSHDGAQSVPIAMDRDGLIAAGHATSQLTWMDAAAHNGAGHLHVFTPRPGKCVEINALWHHALVGLSLALPDRLSTRRQALGALALRVRESFNIRFWSESHGYYIDHIYANGGGEVFVDTALRPNQVIACALEHSPVRDDDRRRALEAVRDRLLTPVGLRTLPADSPVYHGRYHGPRFDRDRAYHQGTVWPWLIGPYAQALLRAGGFNDAAQQQAASAITPLVERLTTAHHAGCLGQLHEIHDAQAPFDPRGCPAQAWSVAQVLEVMAMIGSPRTSLV